MRPHSSVLRGFHRLLVALGGPCARRRRPLLARRRRLGARRLAAAGLVGRGPRLVIGRHRSPGADRALHWVVALRGACVGQAHGRRPSGWHQAAVAVPMQAQAARNQVGTAVGTAYSSGRVHSSHFSRPKKMTCRCSSFHRCSGNSALRSDDHTSHGGPGQGSRVGGGRTQPRCGPHALHALSTPMPAAAQQRATRTACSHPPPSAQRCARRSGPSAAPGGGCACQQGTRPAQRPGT